MEAHDFQHLREDEANRAQGKDAEVTFRMSRRKALQNKAMKLEIQYWESFQETVYKVEESERTSIERASTLTLITSTTESDWPDFERVLAESKCPEWLDSASVLAATKPIDNVEPGAFSILSSSAVAVTSDSVPTNVPDTADIATAKALSVQSNLADDLARTRRLQSAEEEEAVSFTRAISESNLSEQSAWQALPRDDTSVSTCALCHAVSPADSGNSYNPFRYHAPADTYFIPIFSRFISGPMDPRAFSCFLEVMDQWAPTTEFLSLYSCVRLPMVADGNCFYRAAAQHLFSRQDLHQQIRNSVVAFAASQPQLFNHLEDLCDNGVPGSWQDYLFSNSQPGKYTTLLWVEAFSCCFGVEVWICTRGNFVHIYSPPCLRYRQPLILEYTEHSTTEEGCNPYGRPARHYDYVQPGLSLNTRFMERWTLRSPQGSVPDAADRSVISGVDVLIPSTMTELMVTSATIDLPAVPVLFEPSPAFIDLTMLSSTTADTVLLTSLPTTSTVVKSSPVPADSTDVPSSSEPVPLLLPLTKHIPAFSEPKSVPSKNTTPCKKRSKTKGSFKPAFEKQQRTPTANVTPVKVIDTPLKPLAAPALDDGRIKHSPAPVVTDKLILTYMNKLSERELSTWTIRNLSRQVRVIFHKLMRYGQMEVQF